MGKFIINAVKQRIACIDKEMYVMRPSHYSLIETDELVKMAASDAGVQETQIAAAYLAIVKQIEQMVLNGHAVRLGKIGIIRLTLHGKAVEKKEDVSVGNINSVTLNLRPSSYLKDCIANLSFATVVTEAANADTTGDNDDEDGQ